MRRHVERLNPSNVRFASMRREHLPPDLEQQVRKWWKKYRRSLESLGIRSFEHWERGFCCDLRPYREVALWTGIFQAYESYMLKHPMADPGQVLLTTAALPGAAKIKGKQAKLLGRLLEKAMRRTDWQKVVKQSLALAEQEGTLDLVCQVFEIECSQMNSPQD